MPSQFTAAVALDAEPHHFRIIEPAAGDGWLEELATEYKKLRTECRHALDVVKVDGITVVDTQKLKARLEKACIPEYAAGSLSVSRSDFGETISQVVLERDYGTRFGYKSLRDRELVQLPGRGIDAVGLEEEGELLTLVLGETKVSDEAKNPPQVVDKKTDSLSKQHLHHLGELGATSNKLWNISRFCPTQETQQLFLRACLLFDEQRWDLLKLVVACVLVRPKSKCHEKDFGKLRKTPKAVTPATIRFIIARVPDELDATVQRWHGLLTGPANE